MKKTILFAAAVVAISFASCKKDRTCACSWSTVDAGTEYTSNFNTTTFQFEQGSKVYNDVGLADTDETKYTKVSKKYARENCKASSVYVDNYDNTSTNNNIKTGKVGVRTTTTACELK